MLDPVNNFSSPFSISSHNILGTVQVTNHSMLRILKGDTELESKLPHSSWVRFTHLRGDIEPVVYSRFKSPAGTGELDPIVIYEPETRDKIRKVLIGGSDSLQFWLIKVLFLDALRFLSNQQEYNYFIFIWNTTP